MLCGARLKCRSVLDAVLPTDPLAAIPPPAERRLALRVTPAGRRAVRAGHPWLFEQAITDRKGEGRPGDLAVIFDEHRRFLAVGLYDPTSPIRVRVLEHGTPATIDRSWLREKLAAAAAWRAALDECGTTGYRLVHGENDGLPGLVIDRYAEVLVVKLYTAAWVPWLADLRAALAEVCPADGLVLRLSRDVVRRPEHLFGLDDGTVLAGALPDGPVRFSENGLRFEADVLRGQKTGFFFDQRDNRARAGNLAAGKRTLDVFACTGGFSLYAARGGSPEVLSVDSSAPALAAAERHFVLNRDVPAVAACRHTTLTADAFEALADLHRRGERFDLVITDPPAFARRDDEVAAALQSYGRLTELALGVLAPGGTLVMASCSSRVSAPAFFTTVNRAAARAGRPLREIERTAHAVDHPIRFPEGAYLKCFFTVAP
jgi:23S rRNA (cytosine1962-C5)-methyltransferase